MQIKPDEITSILKSRIEGLDESSADLTEVGTVLSVADGIARVHGLENCQALEMLELPHDVTGLALSLESDNVGAVLFGEWVHIVEGDTVKRTGKQLEIPVGEGLLGRIVDPLGNPLDGKGDIETTETRPAEFKAPGVVQRQPVKEPLQTGLKAIDGMIPIGRGQRELIIGDRQTGKTAIAIDAIINNKDKDIVSVYVAIGQRMATVVGLAQTLEDAGALDKHDHRRRPGRRGRADQVHGALRGLRDGRALPLQRPARARHLRRPHQARLRVPPDVAAPAPPAGSRGLPGRRLLPALAPARARGQAQRRPGRRLADGAADHRDAGRRRVGLHPDQRDLDHRRADLPRARPLLLGRAPGHQRRRLGVARRRQRADQADEARSPASSRSSSPSTATSRPSPSSAPTSTPTRRRRWPAASGSSRRSTRTSASRWRSPTKSRCCTPPPTATWTASTSTGSPSSTATSSSGCTPRPPTRSTRSPTATGPTRSRRRWTRRSPSSPRTSATTSTKRASPRTTARSRRRSPPTPTPTADSDDEESSDKEAVGAGAGEK